MSEKLIENIMRTFLSCVLAVIGWMIAHSWSRAETAIANLQLEVIELKLQVTKLEGKIITEERVKEIHHLEMKKQN